MHAKSISVCFLFIKARTKVSHKSCGETICLGKGLPSFCKTSVPIPPTYIPVSRENKITSAGQSLVTQVDIQATWQTAERKLLAQKDCV